MIEKEVMLIDVNALRKYISETVIFSGRSGHASAELRGASKVINRIEAAPTIDPESLRPQGNWSLRCNSHLDTHTGEYDDEFYLECSVCRRQVWDIDFENTTWLELVKKFPYCHCGAKMNP